MHTTDLYETDFYTWTQKQVSLLRTQQWSQLDTVNLIEEIEALGRKERQNLRTGSITRTPHKMAVSAQQTQQYLAGDNSRAALSINLLLEDSPSLKSYLDRVFPNAYELGLTLAIRETDLGE